MQTTPKLLIRIWNHLDMRRRWQCGLLLLLMLMGSVAEIIGIGMTIPFLGVLAAPNQAFNHEAVQPLIRALGLTLPEELLLPITISFVAAALIAGVMRLFLLWAITKFSFATGADLSISIYRRTLYQSYAVHSARNSSEVINGISNKSNGVIFSIIVPVLTLISSCATLFFILVALLVLDPMMAIASFGGFGLIYAFIVRLTRNKLLINSQIYARESTKALKSLQEGLGGIRDVLIDGSQATYCQIYRNSDLPIRRAQGNSMFIGASPRYAMEALGMTVIAIFAYSLALEEDGIASAIPILGGLAVGAQRLLPVLQQVYSSWSSIRGGQASLQDTIELLDQAMPDYVDQQVSEPLPFNLQIRLREISFRFSPQTPMVLKDLNLTISKGSRVGFIGHTGSGKTTLLDIIMGLLNATSGVVEIDDQPITAGNVRAWQAHIAHVPQAIFMADCSIEENIAFGVSKVNIDTARVRKAAQQAHISEVIESWPKKYQTIVGEGGVRLSGGQRQRIGIARALYKRADVIIFDEATSALDNETENSVMNSIEGLSKDLTLLIIAHRLTTLKNCSKIVVLDGGAIIRSGHYQDIVKNTK